ncbi:DMT family transporter [Cryptosporangium minutisporangium]
MTWGAVAVAIVAVGGSGPLMAATAAPALAIAFWRNALALSVLAPVTTVRLARDRSERPDRRTVLRCAFAGVLLAGHFATWVPSVTMTSVATATALVCTQPIWAALIALRSGQRFSSRFWVGVLLAVLGVGLMTGADVTVSGRALLGDALALAGAVLAAAYVTVGAKIRAGTSTTTYTTFGYGSCAAVLLVACLIGGVPMTGYPAHTWLLLVAVTVGPQLLGHSLINWALSSISATAVSVALLLEVPGAAALAWLFLDQVPPLLAWPGIVVLLVGLAFVVVGSRSAARDGVAQEV